MEALTSFKPSITGAFESLSHIKESHDFWDNELFKACRKGILTKDDFKYIFSQYYFYCRNFTRYITAVMTNCDNDLQRASLSENLWEEAGEKEPEKRHAEIFRKFLTQVLDINIATIKYEQFTYEFVNRYLRECQKPDIVHGTAFLSLGTEGLVAEMYKIFIEGLVKAGIHNDDLLFFHIHVECDDEHALTLENMLNSYQNKPFWFETAKAAVDIALSMRRDFFNNLYREIYLKKITPVIDSILDHQSLAGNSDNLLYKKGKNLAYQNREDEHNINFSVERINVPGQILDPRIVRIQSGRNNESHEHAHETFIYVLHGEGVIKVGDCSFAVKEGSSVLIPRWCRHQASNTSDTEELMYLGVTDYNFTKHFPGNAESSYRRVLKADN